MPIRGSGSSLPAWSTPAASAVMPPATPSRRHPRRPSVRLRRQALPGAPAGAFREKRQGVACPLQRGPPARPQPSHGWPPSPLQGLPHPCRPIGTRRSETSAYKNDLWPATRHSGAPDPAAQHRREDGRMRGRAVVSALTARTILGELRMRSHLVVMAAALALQACGKTAAPPAGANAAANAAVAAEPSPAANVAVAAAGAPASQPGVSDPAAPAPSGPSAVDIHFQRGANCWKYIGAATTFNGRFSRQRVDISSTGEQANGDGSKNWYETKPRSVYIAPPSRRPTAERGRRRLLHDPGRRRLPDHLRPDVDGRRPRRDDCLHAVAGVVRFFTLPADSRNPAAWARSAGRLRRGRRGFPRAICRPA